MKVCIELYRKIKVDWSTAGALSLSLGVPGGILKYILFLFLVQEKLRRYKADLVAQFDAIELTLLPYVCSTPENKTFVKPSKHGARVVIKYYPSKLLIKTVTSLIIFSKLFEMALNLSAILSYYYGLYSIRVLMS